MPDVLDVGSVSECQNGVFFVNREDCSNRLNILLDFVTSDWLVGLVTSNACPGHGIFVSSNLEGVEERNLLLEGNGRGLESQDSQEDEKFCFH